MENKTQTDKLHDLLPSFMNTKHNPNWYALVGAIGEADQEIFDLIEQVKNQMFIKTANRPYLDTLGSNLGITRPKKVGMSDTDFRRYIPILAYTPKQVKKIVDDLLNIFYNKESTTAFITATNAGPYNLQNNMDITLVIDNMNTEYIVFTDAEFTDIGEATTEEVIASYNRQAQFSFAVNYYDNGTKSNYIRIFSNTVGSKGSIQPTSGLACSVIHLNGYLDNVGNGSDTAWEVTKIGSTATFKYVGGSSPSLGNLDIGDTALITINNANKGSFTVTDIEIADNSFSVENIFAVEGTFIQNTNEFIKFMRPQKYVAYTNKKRAMVWETDTGSIDIEMPSSPPVVKRTSRGAFRVSGASSIVSNIDSSTQMTLEEALNWPDSGSFIMNPKMEIMKRLTSQTIDRIESHIYNGQYQLNDNKYTYSSRTILDTTCNSLIGSNIINGLGSLVGISVGNTVISDNFPARTLVTNVGVDYIQVSRNALATSTGSDVKFMDNILRGISPNLPTTAFIKTHSISSISRSSFIVTVVTSDAHNMNVGSTFTVYDCDSSFNTGYSVDEVVNSTTVKCKQVDLDEISVSLGELRIEGEYLSKSGSTVILTSSIPYTTTGIPSSYMFDAEANYTVSYPNTYIQQKINVGRSYKTISIIPNADIPNKAGYIVLNIGKDNQEGPIPMTYKPSDNTIAINESYIFKKTHNISSTLSLIGRLGPYTTRKNGSDYPLYITDPANSRYILEDLIKSVKSAGLFVNFIVKYPDHIFGQYNVYNDSNW